MSDLLVDVVAKRPRDPEQLRLLAERLHVPLSREWQRTLRWAGRNVLICGTDEAAAARVLSAAKDAGIETAVRPARAAPAHMRFVAAHAQSIAGAFFLLTALGSFLKLYFFRGYNPFVHFAGLLWLNLVTRNQTVFEIVGPLAAVALSLLIGYLAMISVHVNLAWLRLSLPLVSYAHAPGNEILPLPPIRSPDPRRWWPAVAVVCGFAAVATGGWLLKRIYAPPPREQPRRPPDTRAERTRPVTTVAPAPLPAGWPLAGSEGTTSDGYPRQWVDKAALRSLLWHGRFAELSRDIEELQARFEEDPLREYWPIDAADAFASATPELDAALDAWVKATPDSFAPYLARGSHGVALAYARRGAKYMPDTPASDVVAMQQSLGPAMADLVKARTLRPKLVAAMREQLRLLGLSSTRDSLKRVIDDALVVCPSCFRIRATYLNFARPRWGGSYGEMEDFARAVDDQRWPRLHALRGYVDEDRANLLHQDKHLDEALAASDRACAKGDAADFLTTRAGIKMARGDTAGAIADLDRADAILPGDVSAVLPLRAWARAGTGEWVLAGTDLLTVLRVDPTNNDAREIFDTVVRGLVYQGWVIFKGGARDRALRIYDLAANLAPTDADVLQRREWVVIGKERGDPLQAIANTEAAVKASPDDYRAVQQLDYLLSRQREFQRVLPLWDDYLSRHPDDGPAHMERARTLHLLGRDGDARAEAAKACDLGVSEGCVRARALSVQR
jgi:tetratricopeptide (TPR) repeat protein